MARRFLGCLMFLALALTLFDYSWKLASEGKSGWGWFLFTGLVMTGVALNIWTGEQPERRSSMGKEPISRDGWDLE